MSEQQTRTIKVDYLARVEGEGRMFLEFRDGKLTDVKLKIFEPPRFFEGLLRGRDFIEAPDITARICGICPVAYQMSAAHAMENACGIQVEGQLRALRRLLYCGEWIASHTLHIVMLHAPDFLGYESAIHMAKDHKQAVERGLKLKQAGNAIMEQIGGRAVHPINVRVGGFYRVPTRQELVPLTEQLKEARDLAMELLQWASNFDFPEFTQNYTFVALHHDKEYAMNEGRIISNRGLDISPSQFDEYFEETHVEYSNALHCTLKDSGESYFTGPMARYALNYDQLSPLAKQATQEANLGEVCTNPFKSILVRAVEVIYACDEALRILEQYEMPELPFVKVTPKAATGYAVTEAPRGLLYHRYQIDDEGKILDADIVPPTSQNQKQIEDDLWQFVPQYMHLSDDQLQWHAEQAIRNYDPCISCATHFLQLEVKRS